MDKFSDIKPDIIKALNEKVPNLKCTTCQNTELILIDGFFNRSVQNEITSGLVVGGPIIPTIALACKNCGNLIEFSVGALGLIKNESKKVDNGDKSKRK